MEVSVLTVFFCVSQAQCQDVRKRKELELQILTEAIRNWEGDDIKTLGNVIYMSQVMIQCTGSEVLQCVAMGSVLTLPFRSAEWMITVVEEAHEGTPAMRGWTDFVLIPGSRFFFLKPLKRLRQKLS